MGSSDLPIGHLADFLEGFKAAEPVGYHSVGLPADDGGLWSVDHNEKLVETSAATLNAENSYYNPRYVSPSVQRKHGPVLELPGSFGETYCRL